MNIKNSEIIWNKDLLHRKQTIKKAAEAQNSLTAVHLLLPAFYKHECNLLKEFHWIFSREKKKQHKTEKHIFPLKAVWGKTQTSPRLLREIHTYHCIKWLNKPPPPFVHIKSKGILFSWNLILIVFNTNI